MGKGPPSAVYARFVCLGPVRCPGLRDHHCLHQPAAGSLFPQLEPAGALCLSHPPGTVCAPGEKRHGGGGVPGGQGHRRRRPRHPVRCGSSARPGQGRSVSLLRHLESAGLRAGGAHSHGPEPGARAFQRDRRQRKDQLLKEYHRPVADSGEPPPVAPGGAGVLLRRLGASGLGGPAPAQLHRSGRAGVCPSWGHSRPGAGLLPPHRPAGSRNRRPGDALHL